LNQNLRVSNLEIWTSVEFMAFPGNNLRLGIPSKGRLSELAIELLQQSGLRFRRQDRMLFARVQDLPVDIIFLRADDIPILCAEGAIDLGISGSDLVAESKVTLQERLKVGFGKCRLSICIPNSSSVQTPTDLHGKNIATSFPNLTESFLAKHGAQAHIVELNGSVEVMVALGIADAIVDLVETGSTLAANDLKILTDIGEYQTVLVQSAKCRDVLTADRIIRRLEGIVIARDYTMLEFNIRRDRMDAIDEICPGYNSPTVSPLEDENWFAVRSMVKRKEVVSVMERLEAVGATAILETAIVNCRL
jgi:ATP phosphoribosyltransferase